MKKYFIFLTLTLYTIFLSAQNELVYEQIALDFFVDEIVYKEYRNIKHFLFDGNLEGESPLAYSFCMHFLSKDKIFKSSNITSINIPDHTFFSKNISFFQKIFTSKNKIANIYVFKHYLMDENVVVVIYLSSGKFMDYYYSILIDQERKKVLDYCKKAYFE